MDRVLRDETTLLEVKVLLQIDAYCKQVETSSNVRFPTSSVQTLSSFLIKFAGFMGRDLELFAKHAKRQTITSDDVKLCARRSEALSTELAHFEETNPKGKKKKAAKRLAPVEFASVKRKKSIEVTENDNADSDDGFQMSSGDEDSKLSKKINHVESEDSSSESETGIQ